MATPLNHTGFQLTTFNPAQTITWLPEHSREGGISVSLTWTTGHLLSASLLPYSFPSGSHTAPARCLLHASGGRQLPPPGDSMAVSALQHRRLGREWE